CGILIAPLPLLAIKGAHQRFVEHAQTLASFLADKSRFIAAQGWTEGSSMALAYERRLQQAEGIGWFGLANVYAGMGVGLFVASTGLLIAASQSNAPRWSRAILGLCSVLGAAILAISGAKGGYAAAALGLTTLAITSVFLARWPDSALLKRSLGTILAVGAVCGVLALVIIRGMIGTRIGELSVLFRWFYLEGTAAIFRDHWLTGTGPGGFREAYMLAKPAVSPEDVTSPHSVLFDYASTLGLAGLGAGVLWFGLLHRSAQAIFAGNAVATGNELPLSLRGAVRLMALPLAIGVIGAAYFEQPVASVYSTLIRLVGLSLGVVVAAAVFCEAQAGTRMNLAFGAAAVAIAAHAQIELTCVNPGSVGWVICMLGVCAGSSRISPRLGKYLAAGSLAVAAIMMAGVTLPRTMRWDAAMRGSYASASFIGECLVRMKALSRPGETDDSPKQLVADIEAALGTPIPGGKDGFDQAFGMLRGRRILASLKSLERAAEAWKGHFPTQRALSKLHLIAASDGGSQDAKAIASHRQAALVAAQHAVETSNTTSAWSWLATVYLTSPDEGSQKQGIEALIQAAALAPHEPTHCQRLALLLEQSSPREASRWAQLALDADDRL
ncbi:MAG: O-antigen ligase family protein, partial [Planctomycetota bacterium]|nr:O-antigen ligase family protein [Planctomycetota bacterium]